MKYLMSILCFSLLLSACQESYLPKPTGYFRIDLPEKKYAPIDSIPFPFNFEIPQYAKTNLERTRENEHFLNIDFPRYGARIHMSFLPVKDELPRLLEDSRALVYKHVVKAQDISEETIYDRDRKVYGTYYQIDGNAASGSQFYLTDSSRYFLRGALYFNIEPNYDSIAPVQDFIKKDIEHLIESLQWR
jgi:gliding motility-associated lipoprotein GldD